MKNYYGLIGGYATNSQEGIYSFNLKDSRLSNIKLKAEINNPTYLCNNDRLFSVCSKDDMGGIAMVNLIAKNNPIIDSNLSEGKQPCYISIDPRKKFIFSANYHTGEIKLYSYTSNKINLLDTFKGNENSKMHFVSSIPKTNKGIAIDLGNDEIIVFDYAYEISKDIHKSIKLKPGCGPRHLVFHPSMKFIFVFTEYSNEVVTIELTSELELNVISYTKTLPKGFECESYGAAIRISNDGNYIFVSNRGHNSIGVLEFNEDNKSLTLKDTYSTFGDHPRDFNLTPDDNFLLIANTFSNSLTSYAHDLHGGLTLLEKDISINNPTSVLFL